jgi:ubiquinone/menaquinone biosynthesis C-methylase UbiE
MPEQPTSYNLIEHAQEGARREAKRDAAFVAAQLQLTGLRAGMDALDLGCGTGAVTRVMTTIVGPGRVVGVDYSPARLAEARTLAGQQGLEIEFVEGAATRLPLPDAGFDYTWSRFLFAYLPAPAQALTEMVRVTRPGGSVVVGDLDGQIAQLHPLSTALRAELGEALRVLGAMGFDPWVGRKLHGWFYQAGLRDITVHVLPYQVYTGGVPAEEMGNWRANLRAGIRRLVEHTGERARWERFHEAMLEEIQRPDVFYYCTLILVRGTVPGAPGP